MHEMAGVSVKKYWILLISCLLILPLFASHDKQAMVRKKDLAWRDGETGGTLLHRAARLGKCDEIDRLIALGLDVESKDNKGLTPLCSAAIIGNAPAVERLVRVYGALVDIVTRDGAPLESLVARTVAGICDRGIRNIYAQDHYNALLRIQYFLRHTSAERWLKARRDERQKRRLLKQSMSESKEEKRTEVSGALCQASGSGSGFIASAKQIDNRKKI